AVGCSPLPVCAGQGFPPQGLAPLTAQRCHGHESSRSAAARAGRSAGAARTCRGPGCAPLRPGAVRPLCGELRAALWGLGMATASGVLPVLAGRAAGERGEIIRVKVKEEDHVWDQESCLPKNVSLTRELCRLRFRQFCYQ
ncbi:unnamed protein product, partial [Gulo gulo]